MGTGALRAAWTERFAYIAPRIHRGVLDALAGSRAAASYALTVSWIIARTSSSVSPCVTHPGSKAYRDYVEIPARFGVKA